MNKYPGESPSQSARMNRQRLAPLERPAIMEEIDKKGGRCSRQHGASPGTETGQGSAGGSDGNLSRQPTHKSKTEKAVQIRVVTFDRWRIIRTWRSGNASAVRSMIERSTSLCGARSKALTASCAEPPLKAGTRPWCLATGSWRDRFVNQMTTTTSKGASRPLCGNMTASTVG